MGNILYVTGNVVTRLESGRLMVPFLLHQFSLQKAINISLTLSSTYRRIHFDAQAADDFGKHFDTFMYTFIYRDDIMFNILPRCFHSDLSATGVCM